MPGSSLFGAATSQHSAPPPAQSAAPTPFGQFGSFGTAAPAPSTSLFGAAPPAQQTASYDDFEPIEHPDSFDTDSVEVTETPVALTFKLDKGELVSIPSDGAQHQVTIASIPLEGSISYVCVPKVDPRVYLEVCASCFTFLIPAESPFTHSAR